MLRDRGWGARARGKIGLGFEDGFVIEDEEELDMDVDRWTDYQEPTSPYRFIPYLGTFSFQTKLSCHPD